VREIWLRSDEFCTLVEAEFAKELADGEAAQAPVIEITPLPQVDILGKSDERENCMEVINARQQPQAQLMQALVNTDWATNIHAGESDSVKFALANRPHVRLRMYPITEKHGRKRLGVHSSDHKLYRNFYHAYTCGEVSTYVSVENLRKEL
jgi:hypothetical protein